MDLLKEIGAILGFVAFAGLVVLVFMTFQQARHLGDETGRVEWNFEIVVGTRLEAGHGAISVFLQSADQKDWDGFQLGIGADRLAKLKTVHSRHGDVADHEIRSVATHLIKTVDPVFCCDY